MKTITDFIHGSVRSLNENKASFLSAVLAGVATNIVAQGVVAYQTGYSISLGVMTGLTTMSLVTAGITTVVVLGVAVRDGLRYAEENSVRMENTLCGN